MNNTFFSAEWKTRLRNAFWAPAFWIFTLVFALIMTCISMCALAADQAGVEGIRCVLNPYDPIEWEKVNHYKLNLHTHTKESDGRMAPSTVIDEYHARGYHGLAITDHNRATWPWTDYDRDPKALEMLAIPGNELSRHHHTLSLFTTYQTEETDQDKALEGVATAGGLAVLCHPAMHWLREYNVAPALEIPLQPPLREITQGNFTIDTWFRTLDTGRNILMGNFSPRYEGALNLELHTLNRVRLFLQPQGGGATVDLNVEADTLGINTRDGQWHHLAGIRRNGDIFLYLDGRLAGQSPDRAGAFNLQGNCYYVGRDTRTSDVIFKGDLSRARLWSRAFTDAEALVCGTGAPADGPLAEYAFLKGDGTDTAGSSAGPMHGKVVGEVNASVVTNAPEALLRNSDTVYAMTFGKDQFPTSIPDAAVEHFAALFNRHSCLKGIEIHNRTRPVSEHPLDRELWDRLLALTMPERPIWGAAVDDMHAMEHLGGNWIVILSKSLNEQDARAALAEGRYYFASTRLHEPDHNDVEGTPRIENIRHDPDEGVITITATASGKAVQENQFVWVSNGKPVHTGSMLRYREVEGLGAYARVEITGEGGTTYTNPLGFLR
ncbi:MAG: hypothetical protein GXY07_19990 [Candidatus Hydrogenedentes bacterium]|nr:hypothetical protein [Candidatus Hydrogenedentota bacterium]